MKKITRRAFSASISLLASLPQKIRAAPTQAMGRLQVEVILKGEKYIFDAAAGKDMGSYSDPAGRFIMSCVRVTRTDCPLRVDFRAIPGWQCIIFEYGDVTDQTTKNFPAYSVTIGAQTINLPGHWKFARWRWQSGPWPLPMASVADLVAKKLIPRFDPTMGSSVPAPVAYHPMGIGPMCPDMGTTGGRDDIGWINGWAAAYLCNPTAQNLANTLGIGECCGSWPIHYRDPVTRGLLDRTKPSSYKIVPAAGYSQGNFIFTGPPGTVISPTSNNPDRHVINANGLFWFYGAVTIPASGTIAWPGRTASGNIFPSGAATLVPAIQGVTVTYDQSTWALGSGLSMDAAHWPMMSYVPWLLTGDPYFLENLQNEALWMIGNGLVAGGRPYGGGGGSGQVRAMAWALRNFAQAAGGTPTSKLPSWLLSKATMESILTNQLPKYIALQSLPGRSVFRLFGPSGGQGDFVINGKLCFAVGCYYSAWQEDYVNGAIAITVLLGYTDWLPLLQWSIQNLIHRVNADGRTGWDNRMMATYETTFCDNVTKQPYPDWASCSAAMTTNWLNYSRATTLQPLTQPYNADYDNSCQAALALAWQAGLPEAHLSGQFVAALRFGKGYKYCFAIGHA